MKRKAIVLIVAVAAMATAAGTAAAQGITSSLTGGATQESSDVKLVSDLTDASTTNDASGIKFTLPAGTTFADLNTLSTDFNATVGGCGGGSPRFSITLPNLPAPKNHVFVYVGAVPNFDCSLNTWQSTGNFIGSTETRFDTSQVGGTFYDTYAHALSLVGSQPISEIDLVADSGWFFTPKTQTVLVRNANIDGQVFPLTSPQQGHGGKSPAQLCRAERDSIGKNAFEQKYGTNHNHRNAFGKCVSAMAHQD